MLLQRGNTYGVRSYIVRSKRLRKLLFGDGALAFQCLGTIVYRSTTTYRRRSTRIHEYTHAMQERRLGLVRFTWRYLTAGAYNKNRYELQACRAEAVCSTAKDVRRLVTQEPL